MDRPMAKRIVPWTYESSHGQTNHPMDKQIVPWTNGSSHGQTDRPMDKWMYSDVTFAIKNFQQSNFITKTRQLILVNFLLLKNSAPRNTDIEMKH
jgi:hypothetical protein